MIYVDEIFPTIFLMLSRMNMLFYVDASKLSFHKTLNPCNKQLPIQRSNIPSATGDVVYVSDFILLIVPSKVIFRTYLLLTKGYPNKVALLLG